jgi:hypothetical protein
MGCKSITLNREEAGRLLARAAGKNAEKGAWRMPRLSEAMKDATSCDKLRGGAHTH